MGQESEKDDHICFRKGLSWLERGVGDDVIAALAEHDMRKCDNIRKAFLCCIIPDFCDGMCFSV